MHMKADTLSAEQIGKMRDEYLLPSTMKYFPMNIVNGEMQFVYDDAGKKYLDAFSAVVTICVGKWRHSLPYVFGVTHAPAAYCYRCPLGLTYPSCNIACAREVEDIIKYNTSGKIAAFIAEPIQGFGGCVTPPKEYFEIVYDIVHK